METTVSVCGFCRMQHKMQYKKMYKMLHKIILFIFIQCTLLMHILIDKLRLYLGIHNLLLGIQPVIAGKHVADRTAECIICHSMKAEHLNAEHDGRKRAIRYAAEYRRHAERSRKRRGKAQAMALPHSRRLPR